MRGFADGHDDLGCTAAVTTILKGFPLDGGQESPWFMRMGDDVSGSTLSEESDLLSPLVGDNGLPISLPP